MADSIRVRVGQEERTFTGTEAPITIGSGPGVTMVSRNARVAGRHATIEAAGSRWSVVAAPGAALYLAGQQVPKASVGGGVQLMLGDPEIGEELTVAVGSAALPPSRVQAQPRQAQVPTNPSPSPAPQPSPGPAPQPTAATAPGPAGRVGAARQAATSAATVGVGVGGVNLKIHHNGVEREFTPGQVVTIGRRSSNDIELTNPLISGEHAKVRFGATGWELDDQGSTHGTWYNGQRITHLELSGVTTLSFAEEGNGEKVMFVAPGETRPAPKPATSGGSKTPLLIGVGALAVVALIVALIVAFRPKPDIADPPPGGGSRNGGAIDTTPPKAPEFDTKTLAKGTVKIQYTVHDSSGSGTVTGSGTIISNDGLILTNSHVAAPSLVGDKSGDPKEMLISINETGDQKAVEPKFSAHAVAADGNRDLAVIKIDGAVVLQLNGDITQSPVTDADLKALTVIPVGKNAASGTEIELLGFPGVAGSNSVTITRGLVSSYADGPAGKDQYVNTDAKIEHGNSGGLAANKEGQIVGVPTRIDCVSQKNRNGQSVLNCQGAEGGGSQNRLTAIEMAYPLIDAAKSGQTYRKAASTS